MKKESELAPPFHCRLSNFREACAVIVYLASLNVEGGRHRAGLEEIREGIGYGKSIRNLQRLMNALWGLTEGQLKHDGCTPRGWWIEGDLNTFMRKITEIQNVKT